MDLVMNPRKAQPRPGAVIVGVIMTPLRLIGIVIVAALWTTRDKIHILRDRTKYRRVAQSLGLDQGRILSQDFQWNHDAAQLTIVSLRPGPWTEVLRAVSDRARAEHYFETGPVLQVLGGRFRPRRHNYSSSPRQGRPDLVISFYAPGETIEGAGQVVPADETGLWLRLTGHP
jgi:hypothetical protein